MPFAGRARADDDPDVRSTEAVVGSASEQTARERSGGFAERTDEQGAYLVLYALLAVAFFTMAAVVLDIAALRQGRRADRTAADLAVTAGVTELEVTDPSSFAGACEAAWGYVLANRTETGGATSSPPDCTGAFPASSPCDPATPRTATGSVGPITVEITHPVPNGHPLMLAEAQTGDVAQSVVPAADGTSCERLGVRVVRSRTFLFGQIAGVIGGSTDVHSVGRALTATSTTEVPSVVALEPAACNTLTTDTGGGTLQLGSGTQAGVAIVDSSASGCAAEFVIDGGSGGGIQAIPAGPTPAEIRSFALSQSTFARAYDPTDLGARLSPTPVPALTRTGRSLLDNRYHCPTCGPGRDPIGQLEAERNVAGAPTGSTTITTCNIPMGTPVVVTGISHVYVDCDDLVVDGSVTFIGDSVTLKGNLLVGPNACVAVNDGTCGGGGGPGPADLFVRGNVVKDVKGQLALSNTFLYTGGTLDIGVDPDTAVGNSYLAWTAPTTGPFEDLLFWSEAAGALVIGEQKSVTLVGTFAAPNATLTLNARSNAGGVTSQMQVVAANVRLVGDGVFRLVPTPGRATGSLTRQIRLIR